MTDQAALVASLPTGPRDPVTGTPPRRPGSVRRTTSIEERWDDFGLPRRVRAGGRDLVTAGDLTTGVHDAARLSLVTDGSGAVAELSTEPPVPQLQELVGTGVRSGFRSAATILVSAHPGRSSVLHQLLDDVPLSAVIASYGLTREHPEWNIPPDAAERLRDLCAGWAGGATMITTLDRTGVFPVPEGPPAPPLADDGDHLAWHDLGTMDRRSVRRVRRLDLWREGPHLELEAYFRDSHLGREGPEDVLHEYTVNAVLEPVGPRCGDLRVGSIDVVAHTLPWPECPAAAASARRLSGRAVAELPELVRDGFRGTSTCTHLNDVLRSMGAVTAMAEVLP